MHAGLYTVGVDPVLLVWNKAVLPAELVPTGIEDLVQKVAENPDVFGPGTLTSYAAHSDSYGYTVNFAPARHHGEKIWDWYRSEEHTSELQSLMRISYAVFCLKKKTKDRQK